MIPINMTSYVFPSVVATWGSTAIAVNLEMIPVLMTMGDPKNGGTVSSIKECVLMKFRFWSDSDLVSLIHRPGRGFGTFKKGSRSGFDAKKDGALE